MQVPEIWRPVDGWGDRYEVSTLGRFRSLCHRGKPRPTPWMITPTTDKRGYQRVALCRDRNVEKRLLHRVVLETFDGPSPEGTECAHLDGNPQNNQLINLEWCTKKENMRHRDLHGTTSRGESRPLSIFTEVEVKAIRLRYVRGESRPDIVRDIVAAKGCDPTVVRDILGFRTWKHVK